MDWLNEANAVIKDIKPFVSDIKIAEVPESCNMMIYFNIETLEKRKLLVSMSACGFCIINSDGIEVISENIYETINSLLDANSCGYRRAFAKSLIEKINTIHESYMIT